MYRKGSITVNVADSEATAHLSLTLGLGRRAEHWVLGYGLHQMGFAIVSRWIQFNCCWYRTS
jgi:hypothetical protein